MLPSSNLHDPHADTRSNIDQEISELEQRLVSLKLARNALAPITQLHPEILQEIFYLVHLFSEHRGKTSLLLTWICHRWRTLAHGTSSIWSHINFQHMEWVEAALSRTKNRELEFDLDCSPREEEDLSPLISVCLSNISRVRMLAMSSRYGRPGKPFTHPSPAWLVRAPRLQELHFETLIIPPNLFSGFCPALQVLYLFGCNVDWDTLPTSPSIKELSISGCQPRTSIEKVIGILHRMRSSLEQLNLRDVFDDAQVSQTNSSRLSLENLRRLAIYDFDPDVLQALFGLIQLPVGRGIDVELILGEWKDSRVIEAVVAARNIAQWPVDCIKVRTEMGGTTITFLEDWSRRTDGRDNENIIQIMVLLVNELGDLLPILQIPPLAPVEAAFFLGGSYCTQDATLMAHIGSLGTVRKLFIEIPFLVMFFDFTNKELAKFEQVEDLQLPDLPSFPNLETLEIFVESGRLGRHSFSRGDAEVLRRWLEWRMQSGNGVKILILRDSVIPSVTWLGALFEGVVGECRYVDISEEAQADDVPVVTSWPYM